MCPDLQLSATTILESIDRELAFFRRRSGQVYFLGLSAEAAILVTGRQLPAPPTWDWLASLAASLFFYAVAIVGIILSSEYRHRIHILKTNRLRLLTTGNMTYIFPSFEQQLISEIQVLFAVLAFTSWSGIFLSVLKVYPNIWILGIFLLGSCVALGFGTWIMVRCLRREPVNQR